MQLTLLHGYPDYVGRRMIFAGYGKGPASYAATGDPIAPIRYGNYYDIVFESLSVSGKYAVRALPSTFGPRATWNLLWSTVAGAIAGVATATAGSGQTPGTYVVNGTGGNGAGAQITVTVANDGTVKTNPVQNSAGFGYTAAPTFTMPAAAGGTAATFTATVQTAGPVPALTNLSAETVQLGGYCGQY